MNGLAIRRITSYAYCSSAEGAGIEPACPEGFNGFQDRCTHHTVRPLLFVTAWSHVRRSFTQCRALRLSPPGMVSQDFAAPATRLLLGLGKCSFLSDLKDLSGHHVKCDIQVPAGPRSINKVVPGAVDQSPRSHFHMEPRLRSSKTSCSAHAISSS